MALVFVQLQVEIVKLAYACKDEETSMNKLLDDKEILMYNIHKLESADNIGQILLCKDSDLNFIEKSQLAELRLPVGSGNNFTYPSGGLKAKRQNFVARLFSLKSQAEATERLNK